MATRRYRRSPNLVCFWKDGRTWVQNFATGVQSELSPPLFALLHGCDDWRTATDLRQSVARSWPAGLFSRIVDAMVKATLLERSDRKRDARESRMEAWQGWNPAAGFFHMASRAGEHGDPRAHDAYLHRKASTTRMPSAIKPAPARSIRLSSPTDTPISRVLHDRRTWRQFGRAPITEAQLSTLLALTSGITHWLTVPGLGTVPLTTSPSGGSRHPIESYVAVRRVQGLEPGVYRYLAERHALGLVRRGLTRARLSQWLPQQTWWHDAPFVVFFTGVFTRTQWRYEFPRAYRAVMLEAGHVCQTLLLAATSLGLAPFCTMALNDERVERALKIDGVSEAVLYAAGAGTRPPHVHTRVVLAPGASPARVRANR
jgi:SagB-type dehydrogenase family enzyme